VTPPAATAALPQRLGRYEVLSLLGRGAMGSVYKARDPVLDREVALKTVGGLLMEAAEHRDEYLERFQREARAAARLSHPNIVAVHDLGVDEATGTPFIVMEYVPGVSLAALLREHATLPVAQAVEIADQVAAALEEAHRHGIVHRDVKPGNVFVDPRGRVKVGDFGIARIEGSDLTQTGVGLGTPGYLAPEVVRGGRADARADVFALGALTYALLAGRKPFLGVTPQTLTAEVLESDPQPPHVVRPEVPAAASAAVMHALSKAPEERTATVETFRHELTGGEPTQRVATAEVTAATPAAPATMTVVTAPPAPPRRRAPWLFAAGMIAAALIGLWMASRGEGPAETRPSAPARAATPPPPRPVASAAPPAAPARAVPPGHQPRDGKPGKGHGRGHDKGRKRD
jgi:eukaryotic-like serine/threonine-protein kinase